MTDTMADLASFRSSHPCSYQTVAGATWEVIACGTGTKTVVLLPGALGLAETSFRYIRAFELDWRVLSLSYPETLATVRDLVDGMAGLFGVYGVEMAAVVGGSFSGLVAQYLAAWHPDRVAALLLSNTGAPDPHRGQRYRRLARLFGLLPTSAVHAAMRATIRLFLRADSPEHRFWRAYFTQVIPRFSRRALANRLHIQADMDRPANATQWASTGWRCPTVIVDAGEDRLVGAGARAALRTHFAHARHYTLSGKGHAASLDESAAYLRIYQEFLCNL